VAVAGEDYCIVAADTRMSTGFNIMTRDCKKIVELCVPFPSPLPPNAA
jgi:20S proteasome subunit beta 6